MNGVLTFYFCKTSQAIQFSRGAHGGPRAPPKRQNSVCSFRCPYICRLRFAMLTFTEMGGIHFFRAIFKGHYFCHLSPGMTELTSDISRHSAMIMFQGRRLSFWAHKNIQIMANLVSNESYEFSSFVVLIFKIFRSWLSTVSKPRKCNVFFTKTLSLTSKCHLKHGIFPPIN